MCRDVIPAQESVSQCHCEGVKQPKQSQKWLKSRRLPRSLRSLAVTGKDYDTASQAGIQYFVLFWTPAGVYPREGGGGSDEIKCDFSTIDLIVQVVGKPARGAWYEICARGFHDGEKCIKERS